MIKCFQTAEFPTIDCAVHKIQLCIEERLKPSCQRAVSDVIAKCRKISQYFKSVQAQHELHGIQRLNGWPEKLPIQVHSFYHVVF